LTFESLPEAEHFVVWASTEDAYGDKVVRVGGLAESTVTVTVRRLYYERMAFFDESGEPISVDGHGPLVWGSSVWNSQAKDAKSRALRLRRLGCRIDPIDIGDHEILTIYDSPVIYHERTAEGTSPRPHRVKLPGFESHDVEPFRMKVSEWPASRRVVLRQSGGTDGLVRFSVVLPDFGQIAPTLTPEECRALPFELHVSPVGSPTSFVITKDCATFIAKPGNGFELRMAGFLGVIPHKQVRHGAGVRIEPHYPPFCVIRVEFELPARGAPMQRRIGIQARPSDDYMGRLLYPGSALLGPLPAGPYTLILSWRDEAGRPSVERWGPETFEAGFHRVDWP